MVKNYENAITYWDIHTHIASTYQKATKNLDYSKQARTIVVTLVLVDRDNS